MKGYCLDVPNPKLWHFKVLLLLVSTNKSLLTLLRYLLKNRHKKISQNNPRQSTKKTLRYKICFIVVGCIGV